PAGATTLAAAGGAILGAGIVRTEVFNAQAAQSVGTSAQRRKVELVRITGQHGGGAIGAGGDVWLDLPGRLRDPAAANAEFHLDSIAAGGTVDLLLRAAAQETTALAGTATLAVPATQTTPAIPATLGSPGSRSVKLNGAAAVNYYVHFSADSVPPLPLLDFRLYANTALGSATPGTYDFGLIATPGNIELNAAQTAATDTRVNLRANTDVTGTGVIDVLTNGDISLTEIAGDLRSDVITSNAHDVTLTSTGAGGRILSGQLSAVAGNLSMTAAAAIEDWLPGPGFVPAATANGNITMRANAGGINVRTITSTTGDIALTATGAASDILVDAITASAGAVTMTAGRAILDKELLGGDIEAQGNIAATAKGGNLNVSTIHSSAGNISLTAQGAASDILVESVTAFGS